MERYHRLLELAPRDVVARAITREGMGAHPGEARVVHLDMRHVKGMDLRHRFPGISAVLDRYGLALNRDLIPVRPAAHYLMGGVRTDLDGRTTVRGLYAAGEAACTGVHGANRLASNSLLEGLVFGARAAKAIVADELSPAVAGVASNAGAVLSAGEEQKLEAAIQRLQQGMWTYAGLLREEAALREGRRVQAECSAEVAELRSHAGASRRLAEAAALCLVAQAILEAALARTESRGAHYRNDFPVRDDARFRKHSVWMRDGRVHFERC